MPTASLLHQAITDYLKFMARFVLERLEEEAGGAPVTLDTVQW